MFFGDCPSSPPPLSKGLDDRAPSSPLSQDLDPALVNIACQVVGDETKTAARETSHRLVVQDCWDSQRAQQKQEVLPDKLIMYQISPGYVCSVWQDNPTMQNVWLINVALILRTAPQSCYGAVDTDNAYNDDQKIS